MSSLLTTRFRQEVSKSKDFRMKVEVEQPVAYSTGFLNFDFTNGTVLHQKHPSTGELVPYYSIGIPDGSMTMIIGRSASGKTTWSIQAAANIVRPFKQGAIFHDDIEGGISEGRKMQLTGWGEEEFKERYISRNTGITAENFYERVKLLHDLKIQNREENEYDTGLYDVFGERIYKLAPTVYILDSLALLMPDKLTTEDELSGQMSATATAKMNTRIFKSIIPMLKAANILLFVINHITQKIDINPMQRTKAQVSYLKQGEALPGGAAPIYLSNNIIRFDDSSKLKEDSVFGFTGSLIDLQLVKSRTNRAGQAATLVFNQEVGYDAELSLFIMLKEYKRVNGAGAYLYIDDRNEYKFAQKNLKTKLATEPEFRQIFMNAALDCLKQSLQLSKVAESKDLLMTGQNTASEMVNMLNAPLM